MGLPEEHQTSGKAVVPSEKYDETSGIEAEGGIQCGSDDVHEAEIATETPVKSRTQSLKSEGASCKDKIKKAFITHLGVGIGADQEPEGASYHEVQGNFRVWQDKAGKLQVSLRNYVLGKSIVPETKSEATERGTVPCNSKTNRCKTCCHIFNGSEIKGPSGQQLELPNGTFNCRSTNVVYVIQCSVVGCGMLYVGESKRTLSKRLSEHYRDIRFKNKKSSVANHFNMANHDVTNLKVAVLLQTPDKDDNLRKKEEMRMIHYLGCCQPEGMNKQLYETENMKSSGCFHP